MIVTMAAERLESLEQVRAFVEGSEGLDFAVADRSSRNGFVRRMLVKFDYAVLGKADKGLMKRFLGKATGLSRAQLTRLIGQRAKTGRIVDRRGGAPAKPFARRYTACDVVVLAQVDETLGQVCGQATRAVMRREFEVFVDARFERLAGVSTSHLYNLRKSRACQRPRAVHTSTSPSAAAIGERRLPQPEGRPGFVCAEFTRSRPRRCNDNALRSSRGQARSRARTRASCAATSDANTSPRVSPRRCTSSPAPCSPHT